MQECRTEDSPTKPLAAMPEGPNSRSLRRAGLVQAVLEVMATPLTLRKRPDQSEPQETLRAMNRHERRKEAALARRGR
ncbi:MAG: hypothetical protein P4L11_13575 [Geothrix sp.]|nr:hypothetical protein [Geothrix sp.]